LGQFEAILWIAPKQIERAARYNAGMKPLLTMVILLSLAGEAHAGVPDFNTERFCGEFAAKRGGDSGLGGMSKAVCLMSEESTKAVVIAAWDRVSAQNKENCLKAAGQSYVSLAQCLNTVPAQ
jgi:hypothetical protein